MTKCPANSSSPTQRNNPMTGPPAPAQNVTHFQQSPLVVAANNPTSPTRPHNHHTAASPSPDSPEFLLEQCLSSFKSQLNLIKSVMSRDKKYDGSNPHRTALHSVSALLTKLEYEIQWGHHHHHHHQPYGHHGGHFSGHHGGRKGSMIEAQPQETPHKE